jgi:hypothetical protein
MPIAPPSFMPDRSGFGQQRCPYPIAGIVMDAAEKMNHAESAESSEKTKQFPLTPLTPREISYPA